MKIKKTLNLVVILTCALKEELVESGGAEQDRCPSTALIDCVPWEKPYPLSEPQFQDPFQHYLGLILLQKGLIVLSKTYLGCQIQLIIHFNDMFQEFFVLVGQKHTRTHTLSQNQNQLCVIFGILTEYQVMICFQFSI